MAEATSGPDATSEPDEDAVVADRRAFRLEIYSHVDEGRLVDTGEYVPDHPEGAMTWRMQLDVDFDAQYAFWMLDGTAEAGDRGCTEYLELAAEVYSRSTFEGDSFEFALTDDGDERILDGIDDELPLANASIWELLGIVPSVEVDATGAEIEVADLDGALTALALESLPSLGGIGTDFQTSRLETTTAPDGHVLETRIVADYLGRERPYGDGTSRGVETLEIIYRISPLPDDNQRITPETPILRPGGCKAVTSGIEGTWLLRSFIGGDELPGGLLEQVNDARVTIGADGSLSGTFGCRTFEGSGVIEFASIEQVAIDVMGTPCVSGQFDERLYEDWLVDTFSDDMRAVVDLEGNLFVFAADGEPEVFVVFHRAD